MSSLLQRVTFFDCWQNRDLSFLGERSIISAIMKFPFIPVGAAILLGLNAPAGTIDDAAPAERTSPRPQLKGSPGQELLRVTNEMWFLLSGVTDRKGADAAAARFGSLIQEMEYIGYLLQGEESLAQDLEALDMLHYSIAEALDDLCAEFESLCRVNCYGSLSLIKEFRRAVDAGIVGEEVVEELVEPRPPLTEKEAREETTRFRRLLEPDRAVLATLQSVHDVESANLAIESLRQITERLNALLPRKECKERAFSQSTLRAAREAYAPIEPLLWGIRTELVRIASLPGYDKAAYDKFSDVLDRVYESLANTHSSWFADVFDASFRIDLDEAMLENVTTSN